MKFYYYVGDNNLMCVLLPFLRWNERNMVEDKNNFFN